MTALLITEVERKLFQDLVVTAVANPVDMHRVLQLMQSPEGRALHMEQMRKQSVTVPVDYVVTYSVEDGHPCGRCRHLSISIGDGTRVPGPTAVWMIATEFGFVSGLEDCWSWFEEFDHRGTAVNLVQEYDKEQPRVQ